MSGGIIRVVKTAGFTVLDNTAAQDARLSFKALGIHTYLMTKPDNWQVYSRHLATTHTDGRDAVLAGLKELEDNGYLIRRKLQDEQGKFVGYESVLYERPAQRPAENGLSGLRESRITDNPDSGKARLNKDLPRTSTDKQQLLTLPEWLPGELWAEWQQHRKEIKKPVTPTSARRLFVLLEGAKAKGHDPSSLIETAIARGWQGVVIPDESPAKGSAPRRAARPSTQAEANEKFVRGMEETRAAIKGVFDD